MNPYHEIDLQPTRSQVLRVGLGGATGFAVLGLVQLAKHHSSAAVIFVAVGGTVVLLFAIPPAGRVLYVLWLGLGITLGVITTPIVLGLVYYGVVTPVALLLRALRRDPLERGSPIDASSHWESCPPPGETRNYFKQY